MSLLATKLQAEDVNNFAQYGSDNLFIYHTIIQNLPRIDHNDVVIVGWSHPTRKSFVYDDSNPMHNQCLANGTIYTGDPVFFRSNNSNNSWSLDAIKDFSIRHKSITNHSFFDSWYKNYFSEYECLLNFRAYLDSISTQITATYVPFYFSKESVANLQVDPKSLYYINYIIDHNAYISKKDLHANQKGHQLIADFLYQKVDGLQKTNG
jgi:hypothetical protein